MADITVTVTGTPPNGTYTSESKQVAADGTITILPGITTIDFVRGHEQSWAFESQWILFSPADGPFSIENPSASQVTLVDTDRNPPGDTSTYEYSLVTTEGNFDPQIINKGRL